MIKKLLFPCALLIISATSSQSTDEKDRNPDNTKKTPSTQQTSGNSGSALGKIEFPKDITSTTGNNKKNKNKGGQKDYTGK